MGPNERPGAWLLGGFVLWAVCGFWRPSRTSGLSAPHTLLRKPKGPVVIEEVTSWGSGVCTEHCSNRGRKKGSEGTSGLPHTSCGCLRRQLLFSKFEIVPQRQTQCFHVGKGRFIRQVFVLLKSWARGRKSGYNQGRTDNNKITFWQVLSYRQGPLGC